MNRTEQEKFLTIVDEFILVVNAKKFTLKQDMLDNLYALKNDIVLGKVSSLRFMSLLTTSYGIIIDAMVSDKLTFTREESSVWQQFAQYIRASEKQRAEILLKGD